MFYNYRAIITFYKRDKISSCEAFDSLFYFVLTHECTFCVLNENYVWNIICLCQKLIQKLNHFVTIFVLSRGDRKFFQTYHASKMLKVTSVIQIKSRLISVRSIRHSNRERTQKDAQRSNNVDL